MIQHIGKLHAHTKDVIFTNATNYLLSANAVFQGFV